MDNIATLNINGEEFIVTQFSFRTNRDIDRVGQPSSEIRLGLIEISIDPIHGNHILERWISDSLRTYDGEIRFGAQNTSDIIFVDAYLIQYEKSVDIYRNDQILTEKFMISAREVRMGEAEFIQSWPR